MPIFEKTVEAGDGGYLIREALKFLKHFFLSNGTERRGTNSVTRCDFFERTCTQIYFTSSPNVR